MCVAPPIEYTWCQLNMTSLKCLYRSKHQVIILTVYIALKHCTSHKTNTACFKPAHEYTSSQLLHIYGVSVVICGGLPTRQAASNHHKPPLKRRKYAGFGTMDIRKSIWGKVVHNKIVYVLFYLTLYIMLAICYFVP